MITWFPWLAFGIMVEKNFQLIAGPRLIDQLGSKLLALLSKFAILVLELGFHHAKTLQLLGQWESCNNKMQFQCERCKSTYVQLHNWLMGHQQPSRFTYLYKWDLHWIKTSMMDLPRPCRSWSLTNWTSVNRRCYSQRIHHSGTSHHEVLGWWHRGPKAS